ncbi:hypothetical protein ABIE02_000225 [Leclercia sp. 1548]|uniref:tail fiber domain-containing protein n=1 Tax=Leclercia TaxID=83654 RepID=UPI003019CCAF
MANRKDTVTLTAADVKALSTDSGGVVNGNVQVTGKMTVNAAGSVFSDIHTSPGGGCGVKAWRPESNNYIELNNVTNDSSEGSFVSQLSGGWYTAGWSIGGVRGGSTNLDRVQINVNGGSSNVWSSYLFGANGNAGGGTWNNPSDERLKYNIKTIENPIEKMRLFHGKTFTYKKGDIDSAGYIAQEVQKVLPEVVGEDNDGFLSLNVAGVGALHHEAILVLMDTVDNLTAQVAQLQGEIKALKA